jgi:hypothetical protein
LTKVREVRIESVDEEEWDKRAGADSSFGLQPTAREELYRFIAGPI